MKRTLTPQEIEDILDFITPSIWLPKDTARSICEMNKNRYRKQLKGKLIYPKLIPEIKKGLEKSYFSSLIQPGSSVGVISAQSIGEQNTQNTLSSFHKAGMSNVVMTTGVPRFLELLNATKNPRIINHKIYFKENTDTIQSLRDQVGHNFVGVTLDDISESISSVLEPVDEPWYEIHTMLYGIPHFEKTVCIRVKLSQRKLYGFKLGIQEIVDRIHTEYDDLFCVFSPPTIGQIDIYVNTSTITLPEEYQDIVGEDKIINIFLEECVIPRLEKMYICGIPGILEVFYTKDIGVENEWYVETNAKIPKKSKLKNTTPLTNQINAYKQILSNPAVDASKTISNNIWDIYEVLDIEAAREYLLYELKGIMENINPCHAKVLVDKMTFGGTISSITRHTLKKEESGPMGKASFEESLDNFLTAGAAGDSESTRGVSAAITCGKLAEIGTGMFKIGIDIDNLPDQDDLTEEE